MQQTQEKKSALQPQDLSSWAIFKGIFKLFIPTFFNRIGFLAMGVVDGIIVAYYSTTELAYQSLGMLPIFLSILLINSLTQGVLYQSSYLYGAKRTADLGKAWHFALLNSLMLSIPMMILLFFGKPIFQLMGQPPDVAQKAGQILFVLAFSIPFAGLFSVSQFFLQGIKRPQITLIFILCANVINVFLDIGFVFGKWGMPEMGAVGSALTTTVIKMFLGLSLVSYILLMKDSKQLGVRSLKLPEKADRKTQRKYGFGASANILSEEIGMGVNTIIAGWIGLTAVAAYNIVYRFMMIGLSVATAATVAGAFYVGVAYGERKVKLLRKSMRISFIFCMTLMFVLMTVVFLFREPLIKVYTPDAQLTQILLPVFALVAPIFVFHGGQACLLINLRIIRDLLIPSIYKALCYLVLIPTLSYLLAIKYNIGILGLILSILVSNVLAFFLMKLRMSTVQKKILFKGKKENAVYCE